VQDPPEVAKRVTARLAWLDREPLSTARRYWLKTGTQAVRATIEQLTSRLDLETLAPDSGAAALEFNDLGAARIALARPVIVDSYRRNRATGSFILIDEATHHTVAAGMIEQAHG
jgi:sulfate adenylyltransferase subunit 1